jgi:hypothetical protein
LRSNLLIQVLAVKLAFDLLLEDLVVFSGRENPGRSRPLNVNVGVDVFAIFLLFGLRLYLVEVLKAGALWALFDLGLAVMNLVGLLPDPINKHLADNFVLYVFFNELLLMNGN